MDDIDPVPGVQHAAVLRSPHAHARIRRLNVEAAAAMDGVVGVLTGEDVVSMSKPFAAACPSPVPYYAAAADVTRYVGEPVAVVVAANRYLAEDALERIEVEYEPMEPVLEPGAAALEENWLVSDRRFTYGDPDAAFEHAELTVSERFAFPAWTGLPIETYGVVADWDQGAGRLTAWANFQGPFTLHSVTAAALGLPGSRLRLITPEHSGGSFGIKSGVFVYVALIGLASRKLGVPVRWTEDRVEHLAASQTATGRTTEIEGAFAKDGELLGMRIDAIDDVGAYLRAPEPASMYRMHGALTGAYRVGNVALRARVVLSNRCPSALNRGFGGPQHYLPLEGMMALAARRLQLDPLDLAKRNLVSEFPYRTPSGGLYSSGDFIGCLRAGPGAGPVLGPSPSAARGAAGRTAVRHRHRVRGRAVDLEHGLRHAGGGRGEPPALASQVRQRRRGDGDDQPDGRGQRAGGHHATGAGPRHGDRPGGG